MSGSRALATNPLAAPARPAPRTTEDYLREREELTRAGKAES